MKQYYVYEWFNTKTNEVFYVGKGSGKRYKDLRHRNKIFLDYIANNAVDSRIVKEFDVEEDAFSYEKELTDQYKAIGQCQCCLQEGGYGGYSNVWDDTLRAYWSENNPMKSEEQRQRMRENNPMKNKEVAMKNGAAHKRAVIIDDVTYDGVKDAANGLGVSACTIAAWCKQGGNPAGQVCRYANESQKEYKQQVSKSKKAVIVDGQYFESIIQAANTFGLSYTSLAKAIKANKGSYQGHTCNYANQQPSQ